MYEAPDLRPSEYLSAGRVRAAVWQTAIDYRVSVYLPIGDIQHVNGKILRGGHGGAIFATWEEAEADARNHLEQFAKEYPT